MKYKEGDKVQIKSLDWYIENKDEDGDIVLNGDFVFLKNMKKFCSETLTISADVDDGYLMFEDDLGYVWTDEMFERIVERNGKIYPYKIGDRVVLKGNNRCATITDLKYNSFGNLSYYIKIDNDKDISTDCPTELLLPYDDMVEGLAQEETKPKYEDEVNGEYYSTSKYLVRPSGYQFVDENGNVINATKIVLEKKGKEYPKTYEECYKILGIEYLSDSTLLFFEHGSMVIGQSSYQHDNLALMNTFIKLKLCRDAYWKIAGDEMGLGKSWEPIYQDDKQDKHCIYVDIWGITLRQDNIIQHAFSFPTKEMRDAFYENFKELIESVKELL